MVSVRIRQAQDQFLIDTDEGTYHLMWADGADSPELIGPTGERVRLFDRPVPIWHEWVDSDALAVLCRALAVLGEPVPTERPEIWCDGGDTDPAHGSRRHERHTERGDDDSILVEHYVTGDCTVCSLRAVDLDEHGMMPDHEPDTLTAPAQPLK